MNNIELLIGLLAIAVAIFFGLREFQKSVLGELTDIKEAIIAIKTTVDKTWDLVVRRFGASSGTVVRELENLGTVRITAEPGAKETVYLIEIERPVLREGLLLKKAKEREYLEIEKKLLGAGADVGVSVLSSTRMR